MRQIKRKLNCVVPRRLNNPAYRAGVEKGGLGFGLHWAVPPLCSLLNAMPFCAHDFLKCFSGPACRLGLCGSLPDACWQ